MTYGNIENDLIEEIRMGTTVATNALLERKGEKMALVTNKGLKDILLIGNQARPKIFELNIQRPEVLYSEVVEVDCRIVPQPDRKCTMNPKEEGWTEVFGQTGETLYIVQRLNATDVQKSLETVKIKGINSVAVVFAHSYMYHDHEVEVGKIAKELGFAHVSLSHQVMPMVRLVPRGFTACADAYLTPHLKRYVEGFRAGFKNQLSGTRVLFMQSDGGLTPMQNFNGARAILSGPAGGVVGYAVTNWQKDSPLPIIGFDMGGTSTDVSRFAGSYEHIYETTTAGVTIQAPQLDINTVAAGGGSMLFYRSGLFVVGPESAGAHPGPVCYQKGGALTVTDANLILGRLLPEYFPHIFGPNQDSCLDKRLSLEEFGKITREINEYNEKHNPYESKKSIEEVAIGFIRVANESMSRPIRALTQAKGYDSSKHVLACFGGAGGQHACSIARSLGMPLVLIHKYAGILSAFGMALADVVYETQIPSSKVYIPSNFEYLFNELQKLKEDCKTNLSKQGFSDEDIIYEPYLHMRYGGTDCALMCRSGETETYEGYLNTFLERYKTEFGFTIHDRDIIVDDVRMRGIGKSNIEKEIEQNVSVERAAKPEKFVEVYFEEGYKTTAVYILRNLRFGNVIEGPALIIDDLSTILVEPTCICKVTRTGDIKIEVRSAKMLVGTMLDSVQLSIFGHRFMSIAEQMGRILQRTAISTNIKERLDFSCALFGPDGGLVSNAPHIPVHLGSMQEAVQYQIQCRKVFNRGDVVLSNHPCAGGTHLPDFTVITPVFYKCSSKPIFFVASRGHHADIGGITPGSMPPHSTNLEEEGAAFKSFILVENGKFQDVKLTQHILKAGGRSINDNVSDLYAQVAANQKGIALVEELVDSYGLDVVQAYMGYIQTNAELAVRDLLRAIGESTFKRTGTSVLDAEDYMDDGTRISLKITLNVIEASATFDFSGTDPEVLGNCNAPKAVTLSALIYCLRCMVGYDLPLNQGCLAPVKIIIPKGSILDPSEEAAVVGGNVLTSQRIVDVVFKAFQTCAASQGCMNNITFGNDSWGNYETVAGGSGAGSTWDGCSGVHTHMTNTRITDVEIMEKRYPVFVKQFQLRNDSRGLGAYSGGNGVIRELFFRSSLTLSVLTERRVLPPYGLEGGLPGARGRNLLRKKDGRIINLGPKASVTIAAGDAFILFTPGGGGYGSSLCQQKQLPTNKQVFVERGSLFEYQRAQEGV